TLMTLLKDESVEVRRVAALALTRLATHSDQKALTEASLSEADWLVKFHLAATLQDIGSIGEDCADWERIGRNEPSAENRTRVRKELAKPTPDTRALRAAGKLKDAEAVPLLVPWLKKHVWEYHAAEAAVALGRIGTNEAVAALW